MLFAVPPADRVLEQISWGGLTLSFVERPQGASPRYAYRRLLLILKGQGPETSEADIDDLGKQWLAEDIHWDSHQIANNLRYSADSTFIGQLVLTNPKRPQYALAIANFVDTNSLYNTKREALIRIYLNDRLRVEFVKDLGYLGPNNSVAQSAYPRLFKVNGQWTVVDMDGIHNVGEDGTVGKLQFALSLGWYPYGTAEGKAIIFGKHLDQLAKWTPAKGFQLLYQSKTHFDEGGNPAAKGDRWLRLYEGQVDSETGKFFPRTR